MFNTSAGRLEREVAETRAVLAPEDVGRRAVLFAGGSVEPGAGTRGLVRRHRQQPVDIVARNGDGEHARCDKRMLAERYGRAMARLLVPVAVMDLVIVR